jgi:hypothetical protein
VFFWAFSPLLHTSIFGGKNNSFRVKLYQTTWGVIVSTISVQYHGHTYAYILSVEGYGYILSWNLSFKLKNKTFKV